MPNSVFLSRQAEKFLSALRDPNLYRRLREAINLLIGEPRPRDCVKLSGPENLYRIRVGDYRIVYQIQDAEAVVTILLIGHRRDIYRR